MPYTKKVWTDRTVERPLTFIMQNNTDGTITLIPSEGDIITTGTPITATNLNAIETQYDNAMADGLIEAQNWVKLFGLGGPSAIKNVDLNTISETGFYRTNRGDANVVNDPAIGSGEHAYIYIIHIEHDPLWAIQSAWDYNNISQWTRTKVNGVWTSWKQAPLKDNPIFTGVLTSNGKLVASAGGQAVDIKAGPTEDHAYIGFYKDSQDQTNRSGWLGYGSAASDDLNITNTLGHIRFAPSSGYVYLGDYGAALEAPANTNIYLKKSANEYFRISTGQQDMQFGATSLTFTNGKIKNNYGTLTIECSAAAGNYSILSAPGSDGDVYLQCGSEARVTAPGTTSAFKPILASAFQVNSVKEAKENIEVASDGALEKILSTTVYDYHLKTDLEGKLPHEVKKRKGLIIGEAPNELVNGKDDTAIDLYAMNSLLWKALQEMNLKVDILEHKLKSKTSREKK